MNLKEKGLNYTIISKLIRILIKEEEIKRNNIIIDRALKEGRSMKYVYKETRKRKFNDLKPEDIINWFEEISGKERGTNIDWKKEIKNHKEWTPITAKEVMDRIKKTKRKACGPDGIYTEHLIVGDYQLTKALSELYNQHGREIPKQMNECNVILLKKSKEKMDVRPIALLQCFFKIYTGVLLKRIDKEIEKQLDDSQGGFRAGRNTNQQILQFREIVSTCYEYKKDIYAIFIDFRKAFDSVNHTWITYSLAVAGIDEETIMRIQALYKNPKATFKTGVNEKSTTLTLKSGIRQGDTLSPKLFILLLQVVMNKVKKELEILNEDEKRNLVQLVKEGKTTESFKLEFADDIVIYTYDQKLTEKIAKFIEIHAGIVGLQINKKKTKMMGTEFKKKIEDPVYEVVDRYKYLGRTLTMDLRDDSLDFNERAKGAWRARYKANDLLRRTKDIRIKKKIYNMIIRPVFLYSIEAIRPTKSIILKYVNLEKKITQSIFRKEITLEKNVEDIIKERINKAQKPYRILLDETWKRKPGRPPKKILEMNSMHNEKKLRTQPQRKAKNKTNYTED
uniref:Reverse transcriptase domain-containing protein n=1 Tax=Strongyloides stercoralis TaxID=6248 RepID=A0A0K0DVT6_STRER